MPQYDLLAIGNAIVDVLTHCDDDFLAANGIAKGSMTLVDAARAAELYAHMGAAVETSGGSAANTAAGLSAFGGRAAYIGKLANDQLGEIFRHDIGAQGVHFDTAPGDLEPPTARCMILVTPDGERSMNTFLGASGNLAPGDIDEKLAANARVTFFEGYLWDAPNAREAILRAADIAHAHGREVAFTLSDAFCVERHRDAFLQLIESGTVDIVFANRTELLSLYRSDDLDFALAQIAASAKLAVTTLSEEGAVVVKGEERAHVPAFPIDRLVDTTGAGDLFAAGFLYGYTQGRTLEDAGKLGCLAAAAVIQQTGARPSVSLSALAAGQGLI